MAYKKSRLQWEERGAPGTEDYHAHAADPGRGLAYDIGWQPSFKIMGRTIPSGYRTIWIDSNGSEHHLDSDGYVIEFSMAGTNEGYHDRFNTVTSVLLGVAKNAADLHLTSGQRKRRPRAGNPADDLETAQVEISEFIKVKKILHGHAVVELVTGPTGVRELFITVAPGKSRRTKKTLEKHGVSLPATISETRLTNHDPLEPPKDPSARSIPTGHRQEWREVKDEATAYYQATLAPNPKGLGGREAWRMLRWKHPGSLTPKQLRIPWSNAVRLGQTIELGELGDTTSIGYLLEITWLDYDGRFCAYKWRTPIGLYWSPREMFLVGVSDKFIISACDAIPERGLEKEKQTYREFHQREPTCLRTHDIDDVDLYAQGAGGACAYRSDKWTLPNSIPFMEGSDEYLHQFSDGVGVWMSDEEEPIILIQGGNLDVHPRGIVH